MLLAVTAALVTLALSSQRSADALTATKAYKVIGLTVVVTPSPIAMSFRVHTAAYRPAPIVIAQAAPVQGNVPVTLQTKADPNYQYLHFIPGNTTLNVPYGISHFSCVYQVYVSYPYAWTLTDWGFGTGPSASNVFPIQDYPQASNLAWEAASIGVTSWTNMYNNGAPGQLTYRSTAGSTLTFCVDIQITVPATQPAGTYSAPIEYTLTVSQ